MANPNRNITIAEPGEMIFILIDLQKQFIDSAVGDAAAAISKIHQMLLLGERLQIPALATVEKPTDRKGDLVEELQTHFPPSPIGQVFEKQTYNLCTEPLIRDALQASNRKQCAVVGTETDVCVLQSVLGLLQLGFEVFVVEDCILSSTGNTISATNRMTSAGAIPISWKSLYYELIKDDELDNKLRADSTLLDDGFRPPELL